MTSIFRVENNQTIKQENEIQPLKGLGGDKDNKLPQITQIEVKKRIMELVNSHITEKRSLHTKEEIENLFDDLSELFKDEQIAEFFRSPQGTPMSEHVRTILFRIGRAMSISFGSFSLKSLLVYGLKHLGRDPKYQLAVYGVGGLWTGPGETLAAKLAEKIMKVSIDPIPDPVNGSFRLGVLKNDLLYTSVPILLWYGAFFILAGAYNAKTFPTLYSDNPKYNLIGPSIVSMVTSPLAASFYGLTQAVSQLNALDSQMKSVCPNGETNYDKLGVLVKGLIYNVQAAKHGCEEKFPGITATIDTAIVGAVAYVLIAALGGSIMDQHDENADLWTRMKTGMKDEAIGVAGLLLAYAFVIQVVMYLFRPNDDQVVNNLIDQVCEERSGKNSDLKEDIESQNDRIESGIDEQLNLIDRDQTIEIDGIEVDNNTGNPLLENNIISEKIEASPSYRYKKTLETWHATHEYRSIGTYRFINEKGEVNLIEMSENLSGDSVVPMNKSGDGVPNMHEYTYKNGMYVHNSLLNKSGTEQGDNNVHDERKPSFLCDLTVESGINTFGFQSGNRVHRYPEERPELTEEHEINQSSFINDQNPPEPHSIKYRKITGENKNSGNEIEAKKDEIIIEMEESKKEEKVDVNPEEYFEDGGDLVFIAN